MPEFDMFGDEIRGNSTNTNEDITISEPKSMKFCLGHDDIENHLLELYNKGKLPHAIIFSGPYGVGKSTMAFRIAKFLLNEENAKESAGLFGEETTSPATSFDIASDSKTASLVASGGHPDLLTIQRAIDEKKGIKKSTIEVDAIRKVNPFMRLTASEGGWRIVVIDDADKMGRSSQNAILKILEEPPEKSLIILVCHNIGNIISTIRSRCRIINFPKLEDKIVKQLLSAEFSNDDLSEKEIDVIVGLSDGSIGNAIDFADSKSVDYIIKLSELMENPEKMDKVAIYNYAENIGNPAQSRSYDIFKKISIWLLENFIKIKVTGIYNLSTPFKSDIYAPLIDKYPLHEWINLHDKAKEHFEKFDMAYLDKKQAVLQFFWLYSDINKQGA